MGELIACGLLVGVAAGVLYGFFRVLRLIFSHSLIFDVLFFISSSFLVFSYLLVFNNGKVRFLHMSVILVGFLLYSVSIGYLFCKIEEKIAKKIKKRLKKYCNSLIKYIIIFKKIRLKPLHKKLSDGDVNDGKGEHKAQ